MIMKIQVINVDLTRIEKEKIELISRVLCTDGVVIYPTETFYGLGANCFSKEAVARIYRLKQRDRKKPLSVIVSGMDMVEEITSERPELFYQLSEQFWPGPLTLVLKASKEFPKYITGSSKTIGIRWPEHKWLNFLVKKTGFPITATSANLAGEKEIASAKKAIEIFEGQVDLVADGGKTKGELPSTVLSLVSGKPKILREGALPLKRLESYFK
ncbi:MAG: threonylcarbamoyl-AMP synthase [Candidatus Aminicenantes bacterium]|nr:threonylcarbamoyl-AMP synthase [Candidatus Aminicenantes bacterium]